MDVPGGLPAAAGAPPSPPPPAPPAPPARPPFSIPALRRAVTVLTLTRRFRASPYIAVIALTGGHSWGRANMRARLLPRPPPPPPPPPATPATPPATTTTAANGGGDGAAATPSATTTTSPADAAAAAAARTFPSPYDGAPDVDAVRVAPWAARAAVEALTTTDADGGGGGGGGGGATPASWALLGHLFAGGAVAVVHGTAGEAVTAVLRRSREHLRGGVLLGGMVGGRVVSAAVWDRLVDGPTELETRTALVALLARPPALPALLAAQSASLPSALSASTRSLPGVLRRHGDALAADDGPPAAAAAAAT
ncbi:hypothetical protein I4F81_004749 [Pyropia yezoensis]|uniref:Uncharacterized protein n=1 Tax=Pyropia yezoensis TaxID=2788 RepID=A0ACC3BVZ4_PYRYE|nr:hypothetical protein I4F81_004749 [Neopyropia yezoensis]